MVMVQPLEVLVVLVWLQLFRDHLFSMLVAVAALHTAEALPVLAVMAVAVLVL